MTINMTLYMIRDWNILFENNRTKELKKLAWVPVPNKQDGDGYTELVSMKDGPAMFGAWIAVVQLASKCIPRGTLVRDGGEPHTFESISRITRMPIALLVRSMPVLVKIGWLTSTPYENQLTGIPQEGAGMPQDDATLGGGKTALKGKERKGKEPPYPPGEFVRVDSPIKDLPEHLNTSRMQNKWKVWMNVRMGKNKVKSWPTLFNEQIDWLAGFDESTAFEVVSQSIRNGWQGLFETKEHARQVKESREKGYDTGKTLAQNLTSKTLRDTDATIRRLERMEREQQ